MTKQKEDKPKKKAMGIVAIKHRAVLTNLTKKVEKGGKNTLKQAMLDAGYSERYATNQNITTKKTWKQITDEYLDDNELGKGHNELLNFKKIEYMLFSAEIKDEDIYELVNECGGIVKKIVHGIQGTHCYFFKADGRIRKDAIEMAYKVKGKMSPEKMIIETKDKYRTMTNQELADVRKKLRSRFNKTD